MTASNKQYVIICEKLAKEIFKELGDISGLSERKALTKLEELIVEQINL